MAPYSAIGAPVPGLENSRSGGPLNSGPPSLGCHRSIDPNAMQHVSPAAIVAVAAPAGLEGCSDGFNEV